MLFQAIYAYTKNFEGGYVNNPKDKGGETFRGISRKNWPNWDGWPLIDQAKQQIGTSPKNIDNHFKNNNVINELVEKFYMKNFWQPIDRNEIPDFVKAKIFDVAVNCGHKRAIKFLQETLNEMGNKLSVDGVLGNQTLNATKNIKDKKEFYNIYCQQQLNYYRRIVNLNPSQRQFLKGWERRAAWVWQ